MSTTRNKQSIKLLLSSEWQNAGTLFEHNDIHTIMEQLEEQVCALPASQQAVVRLRLSLLPGLTWGSDEHKKTKIKKSDNTDKDIITKVVEELLTIDNILEFNDFRKRFFDFIFKAFNRRTLKESKIATGVINYKKYYEEEGIFNSLTKFEKTDLFQTFVETISQDDLKEIFYFSDKTWRTEPPDTLFDLNVVYTKYLEKARANDISIKNIPVEGQPKIYKIVKECLKELTRRQGISIKDMLINIIDTYFKLSIVNLKETNYMFNLKYYYIKHILENSNENLIYSSLRKIILLMLVIDNYKLDKYLLNEEMYKLPDPDDAEGDDSEGDDNNT